MYDNSKKSGTDLFIEAGSGRFLCSEIWLNDLTFKAFRVMYRQTRRQVFRLKSVKNFVEWFTLRDAFAKINKYYTLCRTVCQYIAENFVEIYYQALLLLKPPVDFH